MDYILENFNHRRRLNDYLDNLPAEETAKFTISLRSQENPPDMTKYVTFLLAEPLISIGEHDEAFVTFTCLPQTIRTLLEKEDLVGDILAISDDQSSGESNPFDKFRF